MGRHRKTAPVPSFITMVAHDPDVARLLSEALWNAIKDGEAIDSEGKTRAGRKLDWQLLRAGINTVRRAPQPAKKKPWTQGERGSATVPKREADAVEVLQSDLDQAAMLKGGLDAKHGVSLANGTRIIEQARAFLAQVGVSLRSKSVH